MSLAYRYDGDGDRIYEEPKGLPEWDLDGPAKTRVGKVLRAAVHRDILGCRVKWWGYYADWCCGCPDGATDHSGDQQCSQLPSCETTLARVMPVLAKAGVQVRLGKDAAETLQRILASWRRRKRLASGRVEIVR